MLYVYIYRIMDVKFASDQAHQEFTKKKDYKLIILIIASRCETYDFFINCWRSYMNAFPDVKSFFLFSDETIPCDLLVTEDSIVHKHPECNVPGILLKTLHAMNLCNESFTYDYMVRTNLSSFYHIPRLLNYLNTQSRAGYVGSQFYMLPNVPQKQEEINFVNTYFGKQLDDKFIFLHGAGFIVSRDVVVNYCDEMKKNDPKINTTLGVADDLGISMVFYNFLSPADYDEKGLYYPPEFRSLHRHKYQCRGLVDPRIYDNEDLFHIRNKKDDSIGDNSLEYRMDDIQNFILQIRHYYNQPNFMEEAGPILSSEEEEEPEFTNEFTPIESTLPPIPEEEDKMPVPFVEEVIKKSEPVLLQEQSPVDEFIPTKRSRYLIDGFTFYNELEMLYYRMTVLNDVVDYFVITEATKTHAGKDKPLYYNENKDRYKEFHHKIIHVVVDDLIVPDIKENEQWKNENHQRNAIDRGISQLALRKDDLILITDVDEIPNPAKLLDLKQKGSFEFKVASLHQEFYYYNLNAIMSEVWLHPKIATYEGYVICECKPQYIRMNKPYVIIDKGGWHLSYFGDAKFIKNKLENFAHQEFNKEEYTDEEKLRERIEKFQDILIRPRFHITKQSVKENSNLPPRYEEFLSNFVLF